jgi:hypothetical protein
MHVRSPEWPVRAEPTRRLPRLRFGSRQMCGHSPVRLGTSCEPGSPAVPEAKTGSASSYEQPSRILAWDSIRRSIRCGSHKWEPTCSAALRRSTTQSETSCSSGTPSSTQSDGNRHPEPSWYSLTRKRSLGQIQYGPRHFSKSCLALEARMGARLQRFCPKNAGHGAGIPAPAKAFRRANLRSS